MENIGNILNKKKWQPKLDSLEGLPIRPSVKQTRLYLDNEYFKGGYGRLFPHSVTSVYGILAMFANHKRQTCYPAAKTMMELCGITNRNTLFEALKILEAYSIIAIVHRSKGRVPNVYALLAASYWKDPNSISFETVMQEVRKKRTVSKTVTQQSQNPMTNNYTDETRTHLIESNKENQEEINNKEEKKTESTKREIFKGTLIMLNPYYEEMDTLAAYSELQRSGDASPSFTALKGLLQKWASEGKIKAKKPMW